MTTPIAAAHSGAAAAPNGRPAHESEKPDEEFTFDDFLDVINPLHHIPIVSTIYRAISGDEITPHARAIGGGLFGGPIGMIAAGVSLAVEEAAGASASTMLADLFTDGPDTGDQLAQAPGHGGAPANGAAATQAAAAAAAAVPAATVQAAAARPGERQQGPAQPQQPALPFTAKSQTRFFALADPQQSRFIALNGGAVQERPQPERRPASEQPGVTAGASLTTAQSALLERFVSGASNSGGGHAAPNMPAGHQPPPSGATAEWFAARMQANLQKYAEVQADGDRTRHAPVRVN